MRYYLVAVLLGIMASTTGSLIVQEPAGEYLGVVHITRYTHHEGGRLTASGYVLKDSDEDRVCAVSRDLWKHKVHAGDMVHIDGFKQPCVVLDTMAIANSRGKKQLRWVDVYLTSVRQGLQFGIQNRRAWLQKKTGPVRISFR